MNRFVLKKIVLSVRSSVCHTFFLTKFLPNLPPFSLFKSKWKGQRGANEGRSDRHEGRSDQHEGRSEPTYEMSEPLDL